ncbi:MAG: class I SAM-dependent methyltransferase [Elusimicrobia bacterium]|nr:class I SAM-dependent methyltransferase [Elusimicrobiota bacterium]
MNQETPICPLCGNNAPKAVERVWRSYRLYDCPGCEVGFCVPFENPGSGYYAQFEDLYPHQAQRTTDAMSFEYDECLRFLRGRKLDGRRLLDIGCGAGGFLNRARGEGFGVWGVDFNEVRLDLIRSELGIDTVFHGSLEDFAAAHPDLRFDVITMFQVLEHLDRPGRWLEKARSLLAPGGFFFVAVPNRGRTFDPFQGPGMEELDTPPNHLTRWSASALRGFLGRHGFESVEIKSLDVPRPLLALILRNRLRLGLATKALKVDELQHVKAAAGASPAGAKTRLIQSAVFLKESAINGMTRLVYPGFKLACRAFGWQGIVLYCVARRHDARTPL